MLFHAIAYVRESSMISTQSQLSEQPLLFNTVSTLPFDVATNHKKTVLYFFAPWCQVCHYSIENLQAIYDKTENLDVVAIALDYASKDEVEAFIAEHHLTFPVAYGNEYIKGSYKIKAYPSYYVLDKNNKVTAKSMGYSSETGLLLRTL
jgi:peroxiredoxin